jgi:hypothetical protein
MRKRYPSLVVSSADWGGRAATVVVVVAAGAVVAV